MIPDAEFEALLAQWDTWLQTTATKVADRWRLGLDQRDDLYQELRLTAWAKRERYRPGQGSFSTWLHACVIRAVLRDLRGVLEGRERRRTFLRPSGVSLDAPRAAEGCPLGELVADPEPGPERQVVGALRLAEVEAGIAELGERDREVLADAAEGLDNAAASRRHGRTRERQRQCLRDARLRLAERVGDEA